MNRVAAIEARLRDALAPQSVVVTDDSAAHAGHAGAQHGGGHYVVTIVSRRFEGQLPLARHRLVYEALGDMMGREIHALQIEAMTPNEL